VLSSVTAENRWELAQEIRIFFGKPSRGKIQLPRLQDWKDLALREAPNLRLLGIQRYGRETHAGKLRTMEQGGHAWFFKLFLVVFVLSAALTGQEPIKDNPELVVRADAERRTEWATAWLHSEDPPRVAWGAWIAKQDHVTALSPLLVGEVERYQPADSSLSQTGDHERHDALLMVLDALIALGTVVPAKEARKLYPEFAAQSVILLLRSRDRAQPELLSIFQNALANRTWLAAGNVLIKNRPRGFAWLLLSRFTQHITVSVFDQGRMGGVGAGGGECDFSLRVPKAGWPPVGLYRLTQFPDRIPSLTAALLVQGETPVYYWRAELGNYDNPPDGSGSCDDGDRDEYRAQYLNELMGSSDIRLNPYPREMISWNGDAHYQQQVLAIVSQQRAKFRQAGAALQHSEQVLTETEAATLQPCLEIMIHDYRSNQSSPLPHISDRDVSVLVRTTFSQPLP